MVSCWLTTGCSSSSDETAQADPTAPPVETVQSRFGSLPLEERLSGTIRADNQVVIYPEFPGRIDQVMVENGDTVMVGAPSASDQ